MKRLYFRLLPIVIGLLIVAACEQQSIVPLEHKVEKPTDLLTSVSPSPVISYTDEVIPDQYIVVYKDDAESTKRISKETSYKKRQHIAKMLIQEKLLKKGIAAEKVQQVYDKVIKGFSIHLNKAELKKLSDDDEVAYIEQDRMIVLGRGNGNGGGGNGGSVEQPVQEIQWGVQRVGGGASGAGKRAWVLDTGVELKHPDLNINTSLAESFLSGKEGRNADDEHGHGTHVAGIIAALDNEIGVE